MTASKPVVLLTGASGFVGRHVGPALARHGWSVRRAVRKPEGRADEVVIDSIGPKTDWQAALAGVDSVVHLAAGFHHKHKEESIQFYRDVNIAGTLHLARCAATAGVREFIFVSTVHVHGRTNDGRAPFREDDILTPRGLYGMSKAAAEAGLRELARDTGMMISVIRPPLVYGAGAKGNFALLKRAVGLGLPLPFASIRNKRAFLAVQNLTSFILWRLEHPDAASNYEVFLVADDEQVSMPEFLQRLATAAGKRPRLFGMPPGLLGLVLGALGRQETRDSVVGSLELDVSKAMSTGWRPAVTLDEGLRLACSEQDSAAL
jgi:UDP-glucose 4-epimerase